MTRRPLIAGNWKMFKTGPEAVDTATHIAKACADVRDVDIMIAPAYVCLPLVAEALAGTPVHLGAQNLHFENQARSPVKFPLICLRQRAQNTLSSVILKDVSILMKPMKP